jgi:hypothetical protein
MDRLLRSLALLLALGCGASSSRVPEQGGDADADGDTDTDPGATGVDVSITSAVLADDCPDTTDDSDCGDPYCPGLCQQSGMQLLFSDIEVVPGAVEIVTVTLLDAKTMEPVDGLESSHPRFWDEGLGLYADWSETLAGGSDPLGTSYDLTAPDWAGIEVGGRVSWSAEFILEVVVEIDGVPRTLHSAPLHREPEIDT